METYAQEDVIIAFSGGVDSSLLLKLACEAAGETKRRVYAILLHTMLHPSGEVKTAERIAKEVGAVFRVIEIDELEGAEIEQNPVDRCYRCKKYLFQSVLDEAGRLGVKTVIEGTNRDDREVYRPGIRAVKELGMISPLADAGFTKEEVRRLAGEYGLSVCKKPSTPCLATRFPYGTRLVYEEMRKVEKGEDFLKSKGFYNVRLRVYETLVRIETDEKDLPKLVEQREEITEYLKSLGYRYITVDLEGYRSGSMDAGVISGAKEKTGANTPVFGGGNL